MENQNIDKKLAQALYTRIKNEIANCRSTIEISEPENIKHHQDIVYENKIKANILEKVLQDAIQKVEQENQ